MVKSIEELKKATVEELLSMNEEAKGHNEDFQSYFGCDFTRSTLGTYLKAAGCISDWYYPGWYKQGSTEGTQQVTIKMSKDNDRMNLNMTKECKQRYEKFLADKAFNYVHTTAALEYYMDAVESGRIDLNIKPL